MSRFKHLEMVKKVTRKQNGEVSFAFSGAVLTSFKSLSGITCLVVQNPTSLEMHIDREDNFELVINLNSIKPAPPLEDPNRPINP